MTTNSPKHTQAEQAKAARAEKSFKWLIKVLAIVAVCLLILYFSIFHGGVGDKGDFGAFGDFFGGVLNPILGFATVSLLVWSLKYQMDELALTRDVLKQTQDEATLSRRAMEDQVKHLQKEAKLSEALRIIGDLRTHISIVSSYKSVLSLDVVNAIISGLSNFSTTSVDIDKLCATTIHDLLYGDKKAFFEKNALTKSAFKKQYDLASQSSQPNSLMELEDLLLQFSTVAIFYYKESHNQELSLVYLLEAERLLTPFHSAVTSKQIKTSLESLKSIINLAMKK